ncbi:MAG: NAD(P)-dependent oxidoreductase [Clostridia bacterium]|nr:NAD(P)-dependent oxidoreductase [Clostridia bacterium]
MSVGFPLHVDLKGNNCTVFGGGKSALRRVKELLRFGAKVTVVSAQVCPELEQMSADGLIRHIPRKYFRGDCNNAQLCIAATEDNAINIAISTECKNKGIPVNVTQPRSYGTFTFPRMVITDEAVLSVTGTLSADELTHLQEKLQELLPELVSNLKAEEKKA